MNLIIEVFKMFPHARRQRPLALKKKPPKLDSMKTLFSEGFQEGCNAFTKEMGYPQKTKS